MAVKIREHRGKWWLFVEWKGRRKKKCIGESSDLAEKARVMFEARLIQEQLGHSSIQITSDVYGHLVPGANQAAADRLDELAPPIEPHPSAPYPHPAKTGVAAEAEKARIFRENMVAPGLEPGTSCM